jgi:hypothetical protein
MKVTQKENEIAPPTKREEVQELNEILKEENSKTITQSHFVSPDNVKSGQEKRRERRKKKRS